MKTKTALFLGLMCATNVSFADLKVGVIDMNLVMKQAPQLDKLSKRFEQKFGPRAKILESQRKEIQTLEEKLNKDASVMSEAEKQKAGKDFQNKIRDLNKSEQEFKEDVNNARNEELGKLQRKTIEIANGIAKDEEYDLVLFSDVVVYKKEPFDITTQVVKKLYTIPE